MKIQDKINLINVTSDNVSEVGVFCIKDKKADGFHNKVKWFKDKLNNGLTIKIATDADGNQLGFIEYIPSELAWRPIKANNYLFIQCITVYSKKMRNQGMASYLISACEQDAKAQGKDGICTMSSKGSWMAERALFDKFGFEEAEKKDRFELLHKSFGTKNAPEFYDWNQQQAKYTGWNLIYADQCPWHAKSVQDLTECSKEHGIKLKVTVLKSPQEAQKAPSGFGVFNLIKDGKLLADHYISRTRFENILKREKTPPTKNK
jgi:GNAT superfamily N-acetyltransferase